MRLALHVPNFSFPGQPATIAPTLRELAAIVDEGGWSAMTLMDHYFQMEQLGGPPEPMLEGYTALGFLSAVTKRLDLGLLVTGVTYRHPGLLAKIVTTLDVLSQGRAMLGIGAAWYDREHAGLGVPYPSTSERFERLEETLQIVLQMWGAEEGAYRGRHYQLAETVSVPAPLRQPRPPILIGGSGERKTLRLVATYADACNFFGLEAAELRHKVSVLRGHCEDVERDPADILVTTTAGTLHDVTKNADEFLRAAETAQAEGLQQIWLSAPGHEAARWAEQVTEQILPRLSALG